MTKKDILRTIKKDGVLYTIKKLIEDGENEQAHHLFIQFMRYNTLSEEDLFIIGEKVATVIAHEAPISEDDLHTLEGN